MIDNWIKKRLAFTVIVLFISSGVVSAFNINSLIEKNCLYSKVQNISISGNPPEEEWNRTFGGIEVDRGFAVQQTSDGGYIIAGLTTSYGNGYSDFWLIKTDNDGTELWNKTFGGIGFDSGKSVQQTSDGGYVIAGYTNSFGTNGTDVWLIKTDVNGNEIWNKTLGGLSNGIVYDVSYVQQTSDGGYVIVGSSMNAYIIDFFLIKTDSDGNQTWLKTYGGTGYDWGSFVQQTSDGGYVIIGTTGSFGSGSFDVWLIRTDVNGNECENKTFGGTEVDKGIFAQETTDGGLIIVGETNSYGFGFYPDVWLIKIDENENEVWNRTFGGTYHDSGCCVKQTCDGGYIILGKTYSFNVSEDHVWLIKADPDGNEVWNKTFGGTDNDLCYFVQQTTDGGYVLTGSIESYGAGNLDAWLIKMESDVNNPPSEPIIDGTNHGRPGVEYTYCINLSDPDNDSLFVLWDWGDGTNSGWLGPYVTGEEICISHTWIKKGTYKISVVVKDQFGASANAYLHVTIPRTRILYNTLFLRFLERFRFLEKLFKIITQASL